MLVACRLVCLFSVTDRVHRCSNTDNGDISSDVHERTPSMLRSGASPFSITQLSNLAFYALGETWRNGWNSAAELSVMPIF